MHRSTPLQSALRAFTSGGARGVVTKVDDSKQMQEIAGNFMNNESRSGIEAPQNYGFTSHNMGPTLDKLGKIVSSAEHFISFIGGSRSFPVAAVIDDRRYRLKELKPGDVAVFDYLQHQMHFNNDGVFITGRTDKKMKFQLAEPPQDQSGADTAGSSSSGGQQMKGQKQRYNKPGKQYLEMTNDTTNLVHDKTINYKTGVHNFQPPSSAGARSGSPLVQIFGDKFTAGLGHFMKQVIAAPPTSPMHLATKGYIDSIFSALGITIPTLPSLPMPPLPPGVTLPPGITLPLPGEASVVEPAMPVSLEARLLALESRVAELEKGNRHS